MRGCLIILLVLISGCATQEKRVATEMMSVVDDIAECQRTHREPGEAFLCLAYANEQHKAIPACVWNGNCAPDSK